ncbi:ABC transporter substrate-binding protein [Anoxybacterium hadale]|uniref:ABC transporter substrate-binding protein n=2 Tax=Anoxybacterium hadale TaxID=3408580 RepID=A0ACD1AHB0_9FIRM|nr:ABC transporter substrate-binding protein [Clostridiales bacterium]
MKLKKFLAVILILALAFSAAACGASERSADETAPDTRIFVDSAGREVELPAEIDAIAPSGPLAQIVLYTACPDKLAGIAVAFSDQAKALIDEKYWGMTQFGQFYGKNASLNMEALIAAAPDVIVDIGEAKDTIAQDMDGLQQQLNMPVVFIEATLDTMDEAYEKIGELIGDTGETDQLAQYCKEVSEKAAKVSASVAEEDRLRVYEALGDAGLNTNARGSFHAEVIETAGGINAADLEVVSSGAGSEVSMEQVIGWNPDVILAESEEVYQMILSDKAWSVLDAVKNGRVYKIPASPYSAMANPPSVNRIFGILWLGDILYPDQYGVDISLEMQEFYKLFYHVDVDGAKAAELLGE